MTTALVSGATSSLGASCVTDLRRAGWTILTCGRRPDVDQSFEFEHPFPLPERTFQGKADLFIHFAAATELVAREEPLRAYRVNALGTQAALAFCLKHGIENFVLISTRHVFGTFGDVVTENSVPDPVHHYGMSKLIAERMLFQAPGPKRHVFRVGNTYGLPEDINAFSRWSLIPYGFCRDAVVDREINLKTSGLQWINFVPVGQVSASLLEFEAQPMVRHIVSNDELTVREFALLVAELVEQLLGYEVKVNWPKPSGDEASTANGFLRFRSRYPDIDVRNQLSTFICGLAEKISELKL